MRTETCETCGQPLPKHLVDVSAYKGFDHRSRNMDYESIVLVTEEDQDALIGCRLLYINEERVYQAVVRRFDCREAIWLGITTSLFYPVHSEDHFGMAFVNDAGWNEGEIPPPGLYISRYPGERVFQPLRFSENPCPDWCEGLLKEPVNLVRPQRPTHSERGNE